MDTIIIPTNQGLQFCNTDNIIRIQGMSNYCKIYFADNSYPLTVAKVLHWFEDHLPVGTFWRTHKTHLINIGYIKQFHTAQKPWLLLYNGELLAVSRRRASLLKKIA
ncbi:MAG: LytTR family DNA-binding domain-containing protein [Ferruginibacter sp.]